MHFYSKKNTKKFAGSKKSPTFALALRHKQSSSLKSGALVQLVRIHACHAWGHGFESRTHRKSLSVMLRGFFVYIQQVKTKSVEIQNFIVFCHFEQM